MPEQLPPFGEVEGVVPELDWPELVGPVGEDGLELPAQPADVLDERRPAEREHQPVDGRHPQGHDVGNLPELPYHLAGQLPELAPA
jgi:hypothetical protein